MNKTRQVEECRFGLQIQIRAIWVTQCLARTGFLQSEKAEPGFYGTHFLSFDLSLQCKSKLDQSLIV